MIRVVIDTNIVVSAMLRSGGLPEVVFNFAIHRQGVQLYYSEPIAEEYAEVLSRARLDIHPKKVKQAMAKIREAGSLVIPTVAVTAAMKPDENIFLECAQEAEADYVVTGNLKDFPRVWLKTQVVSAREFIAVVAEAQSERS